MLHIEHCIGRVIFSLQINANAHCPMMPLLREMQTIQTRSHSNVDVFIVTLPLQFQFEHVSISLCSQLALNSNIFRNVCVNLNIE